MDSFILAFLLGFVLMVFNAREQRKRIGLLGSHLQQYNIERLMSQVTDGYARALGEEDGERRAALWKQLAMAESALAEQFQAFSHRFAKEPALRTRISRLPLNLPGLTTAIPQLTFDARRAMALHAQSLNAAVHLSAHPEQGMEVGADVEIQVFNFRAKERAFTVLAEMMLMQHTCHWFCKSKWVASARLLTRHQTDYAKVLASVTPDTRRGYLRLVAG